MRKKVIHEDKIIGAIYYSDQIIAHERSIFINLFRLEEEYRKKGLFKILFNTIMSIAVESGIHTLYISVGGKDEADNDFLYKLYQRYGFSGPMNRMKMKI